MGSFFRENLGLKTVSLLIAVMLEIYFYSPDNSTTATLTASVQMQNLPPNMMVVWPPTGDKGLFAKFRIKGPTPLVRQVEGGDHRISVNLPTPIPATYQAIFTGNQLRLPAGITVLDIDPPSIEMKLERVVRKELLVIVDKVGEPAPGYVITEMKVFPETVFAKGPMSELEGLGIIETQKVDVSGFRRDEQLDVPLVDKGMLTTLGVNVVRVEVKVSPIITERTFRRAPVTVVSPPKLAAAVQPATVDVVLSGPDAEVNRINEADFKVVADASKLSEGTHRLALEAELPTDVEIVRTVPEMVTVTLAGENE